MKLQSKRKVLIATLSILAALIIIFVLCAIYLGSYYSADTDAIEAYLSKDMSYTQDKYGTIAFEPLGATKGFIFYPGGKVEHEAYIPLMASLAENGILCVLVEMPFKLAVFDVNAAEGIQEKYPQITEWYIGGHSLGGSMAASYVSKHTEEYKGLVLLGSYSTADLSQSSLKVLSVYGSEDKVLNQEKYNKYKENLPQDFEELVIEGGCHANFGMYGHQDGDGTPTVTNEEQIIITVDSIINLINKK